MFKALVENLDSMKDQIVNFSRDRYENYINKLNGNSRNLKHSYKDRECL